MKLRIEGYSASPDNELKIWKKFVEGVNNNSKISILKLTFKNDFYYISLENKLEFIFDYSYYLMDDFSFYFCNEEYQSYGYYPFLLIGFVTDVDAFYYPKVPIDTNKKADQYFIFRQPDDIEIIE
jgi:hypothetical protein